MTHGYHRRFCLWTELGRGSIDDPGLTLGLEFGGSCRGVLFRIAADGVDTETKVVWYREMVGDAYQPRWIRVRTDAGPVDAIAFVINHDHPRYAGRLNDDSVVDAIARAHGPLGRCADYLLNTAAHLEALGIADRRLNGLRDRVLALAARGAA